MSQFDRAADGGRQDVSAELITPGAEAPNPSKSFNWTVNSWALFILTAGSYWLGSQIAFELGDLSELSAVFFVPAGITLGLLLRVPRDQWWIVLVTAALVEFGSDVQSGLSASSSLGFAIANSIEPLVGATLALAWAHGPVDLSRRRGVGAFLIAGVGFGPLVGATIGAITNFALNDKGFAESLWQWWIGDALGALVVGGAILAWSSTHPRGSNIWTWRFVGMVLVVAVMPWVTSGVTDVPLEFLTAALIIVAGGSFGSRGATTAAVVASISMAVVLSFDGSEVWIGVSNATAWAIIKSKFGLATMAGLVLAAEGFERHAQVEAVTRAEGVAASEALLRSVFDSIDEGYYVAEMITDDSGLPVDYRFIEANQSFGTMTSLKDNPAGRTVRELVPDMDMEFVKSCGQAGLNRIPARFEYESSLSGRFFEVFATPIEPAPRFAVVFKDQTQRHLAEEELRTSERRFRAMADDLPLMMWTRDINGNRAWANATFCDYFGVDRSQLSNDPWQGLVEPGDVGDRYLAGIAAAIGAQRPLNARVRVRRGDGAWRWIETWATPRFDDDDIFLGHLGTSADVTAIVEAEQAVNDSATFTRRVLDQLISFVTVLNPDGTVVDANHAPLKASGIDNTDVIGRAVWDCPWWDYDRSIQQLLIDAVAQARNGDPVSFDVPMRVGASDMWVELQVSPLRTDDGTITHLIASTTDLTERRDANRRLADTAASERDTRLRVELLGRVAFSLASTVTIDDIADTVLGDIKSALGLDFAELDLLADDQIHVLAAPGPEQREPADREKIALDASLPGPVSISTNTTIIVNNADEIQVRFPTTVDTAKFERVSSLAAFPIRTGAVDPTGALVVGAKESDWFTADRLHLLSSIVAQSSQAIQRARLHHEVVDARDREHFIALRLQDALLPDQLIQHPELLVAARYEAATDSLTVGGDWYDTFNWPDGSIGLMVGDVVGHDLEAAATMGRLRSALAAIVPLGAAEPIAVIDALDRCTHGRDGADFVTAACIVIDPATGELTYSTAGHPPPVVVAPDGKVTWLDQAVSTPSGRSLSGGRNEAKIQLVPNSTVVLYTDGLVERRGSTITDGLTRLGQVLSEMPPNSERPMCDWVDELVRRVAGDVIDDDVAVLVARFAPTPEVLSHRFRADTGELGELRRRIDGWLADRQVERNVRNDVLLAVNEAATNAIEHAYLKSTTHGFVTLELSFIDDCSLIVHITDDGDWRPPIHDPTRGRGTRIMEQVASHFERTIRPSGTTVTMHLPTK